MKTQTEFGTLLKKFFSEWLINDKKVSPNTISSYKFTFSLLLKYAEKKLHKQPSKLEVSDLNVDFICDFLTYLIKDRKTSGRTRNVRLSAIKSFFRFVSFRDPGKNEFTNRILAIPESKVIRKQIHFLTAKEIKALLDVQNLETWVGRRDHIMISVAIETGLRLKELILLEWKDIHMTKYSGYISCIGKGRKERSVPYYSSSTAKALKLWKEETSEMNCTFVFPNNKGKAMSEDCFQKQLTKYTKMSAKKCASLENRKVTPHVLRHTAAMNFLQAGIDLSTIAILLGHESILTTQIYIEADMKSKEEALSKLKNKSNKLKRFKPGDVLMEYLKGL